MKENYKALELIVIIPVYNEQASIKKVIQEWIAEIDNWTERFIIVAIDDGSKDKSLEILYKLKNKYGSRLDIISRENRGHGETCIEGYRIAIERGIPYIFQIDSDGQCDPQYFFRFWRNREKYDVIYGNRVKRDDGFRRVLASSVLKTTLLIFAGVWCIDANVPYRLMRTSKLELLLKKIPANFFLKNVALAILLKRNNVREGSIKIHFRERYGGEPSVKISNFGKKAVELIHDIKSLKINYETIP